MNKGKVLVGMSGGVDSSVAAWLLKDAGYEVTGCNMRLYDYAGIGLTEQNSFCGLNDVEDARRVAESIGADFLVLDRMEEFRCEVMQHFTDEYLAGRTPNPCIDCNRSMKFGYFYRWAMEHGFDYIATGHYARIIYRDGRWYLRKALDLSRDQSYVLYPVRQEVLSHLLLPLGDLRKEEDIRRIAEEMHFVNARKHDSQDICFVPDGDYCGFIRRSLEMNKGTGSRYTGSPEAVELSNMNIDDSAIYDEKKGIQKDAAIYNAKKDSPEAEVHFPSCLSPGNIIDQEGNILGQHRGAIHYTIGQRRGLGLAVPKSVYVLKKNMQENTVTVGPESALFSSSLLVKDVSWMRPEPAEGESFRSLVRIRYQHREKEASLEVRSDGTVQVLFDSPQRAVCSGQSAVFYDGDIVLGGGIIV